MVMQHPSPNSYPMVQDQQFPGPRGHNTPRYAPPGARRSRHPCLKYYCCCSCTMLILLLLFAACIGAAYAIINPSLPKFVISDLASEAFNLTDDYQLRAHFVVTIVADNPNKYISIIYEKDSTIDLLFREGRHNFTKLFSGKIPEFKQPTNNVTSMKIDLKGDLLKRDFHNPVEFKNKVIESNQIPLVVTVKARVSVIITGNEIDHEVLVKANCSMNVNSLSAGKPVKMTDIIYDAVLINYLPD